MSAQRIVGEADASIHGLKTRESCDVEVFSDCVPIPQALGV